MSAPPVIFSQRPDTARRLPGWLGALRGAWLLNWRSQLTLRKLPGQLGLLVVLPFLVYITTKSQGDWSKRHVSLGNSFEEMNSFSRRLKREQITLEPKTRENLAGILAEVNSQHEASWHEISGEDPADRRKRLNDHVAQWHKEMLRRAKEVLDDRQYEQFQSIQERTRDRVQGRLNEVSSPWNRTEPFYYWLIDFYFFIILPLACVFGCGPLIRDELQADTLGFLITRPVGRARLLIVKFAAQVAWLEIILLLETLLLFGVGAVRDVGDLRALLALVVGVQILVVPAWSALGLLLGQLTTRYMATALLYGSVVEMGIGRIPTNINTISIMRHIQTLFSHNTALQGIFAWTAGETSTALIALVAAPIIFLGLATLLFTFVEYHHAAEMQK